jgi:hypothetical protein
VAEYLWIVAALLVMTAALLPGIWWYMRLYFRARGKGYSTGTSMVVNVGLGVLATAAMSTAVSITWRGAPAAAPFLLLPPAYYASALGMTPLVALAPRRQTSGFSSFLTSRASAAVQAALVPFMAVLVVGGLAVAVLGSPTSGIRLAVSAQGFWLPFLLLRWARRRVTAPDPTRSVADDHRPPVLYLREFRQESAPYVFGTPEEMRSYTTRPSAGSRVIGVTFEQYFRAEFERQVGPFVALGNPQWPCVKPARTASTCENVLLDTPADRLNARPLGASPAGRLRPHSTSCSTRSSTHS